ncbi:M56 family metallopeptidase [Brevibacillus reuszeri]|uniref:M56 family metallopeptidase n=1 Tax=Brevibacillus reuszeri TaxID=54915 RepID=UPI003D193DBC
MMTFLMSLMIGSFVGTIIWIVQSSIKPVTQKIFSQTWHYYTGLIPVFFLLGGSEILSRMISFLGSIVAVTDTSSRTSMIAEQYIPAQPTLSSLINQQFDNLLRLPYLSEMVLFVIVLWAAGAIIFLVSNVKNYYKFKFFILAESRVCDTLQCPVQVIVSAHATTPMLIGLWKPMIVLPDTQLEDKELALILSHEIVHLQRGDLFVKLLVLVANAVHWFNPVTYLLNKQMNMQCELACDEKVVKGMDAESRRLYGEMILSMLEYGVNQRNIVFTSSFSNSKHYIKRRLSNLMKGQETKRSILLMSFVALFVLIGAGGLAAYVAKTTLPVDFLSEKARRVVAPLTTVSSGYNKINVKDIDGTMVAYDKNGNRLPATPKGSDAPEKLTDKELVDRIKKHLEKQLPVPEGYLEALPQNERDALNEAYSIQLHSSN